MARRRRRDRSDDDARRQPAGPRDDDELHLWERAVSDVRRLTDESAGTKPRRRRGEPPPRAEEPALAELLAQSGAWDVRSEGERFTGRAPGVDVVVVERLSAGSPAPTSEVDLHRLRLEDAHGALTDFIADAARSGERCVLVITGVGSRERGSGVIRRSLPVWLSSPPISHAVDAFASAQPRDGGLGATYVLLR